MAPRLTIEWKERERAHRADYPITEYTVRGALEMVSRIVTLKYRLAYIDGQAIDLLQIQHVLSCYANSYGTDRRAYCWIPQLRLDAVPRPVSRPITLKMQCTEEGCGTTGTVELPPAPRPWLWPCRQSLSGSGAISLLHPATVRQQVEAALAAAQVQWCPRLQDLDEWELFQWGAP